MATNRVCRQKCIIFRLRNRTNNRVYCYVPRDKHHGMLLVLYDETYTKWDIWAHGYNLSTIKRKLELGDWLLYEGSTPQILKKWVTNDDS